jgi:hypothetical protein
VQPPLQRREVKLRVKPDNQLAVQHDLTGERGDRRDDLRKVAVEGEVLWIGVCG